MPGGEIPHRRIRATGEHARHRVFSEFQRRLIWRPWSDWVSLHPQLGATRWTEKERGGKLPQRNGNLVYSRPPVESPSPAPIKRTTWIGSRSIRNYALRTFVLRSSEQRNLSGEDAKEGARHDLNNSPC